MIQSKIKKTEAQKDIYKYYLSSRLYTYDRMYIKNKEGENVAKLYDYIAQNICQYFLYKDKVLLRFLPRRFCR